MPTAFTASIKGDSKGPVIALLAEYDALPGIGHACGHNLIAMTNIGAFLGFLALKGNFPGEIKLIGTPAEEGGGGKISLLDKNIFDDIDISLSSHGSSNTTILWEDVPMGTGMSLATSKAIYEFYGKSSHAAASPEKGLNALNAVINLFSGIDAIRQHVPDDVRIHGIITEGGKAPNIVPDFCAADFLIRSKSSSYLDDLRMKINNIAQGAALMTGTELKIITTDIGYKDVIPNTTIAGIGKNMIKEMDIVLNPQPPNKYGSGGGTDFGNVSHVMPSYAFNFAVSETPVTGHSPDMEKASISDLAHNNAIAISKGISAGHGDNTYRGLVRISSKAHNSRNYTQCDSLLMGNKCGAHTIPYIENKNSSSNIEHEATTSKISEEQLFYCNQRGLNQEEAISLIVNGFCKEVLQQLPMEFAVEAQKLVGISLEGSVG